MSVTGLTLTRQPPVSATATTTVSGPASSVWSDLAADLTETIEEMVMDLVGDEPAGRRGLALEERGVTALDGLFASAMAGLADADPIRGERLDQARVSIGQFGAAERSALGVHAPREELRDGPLAVLDAADRVVTITVRVGEGFRELRAGQREDIADLFADLADVADLHVVAGRATQLEIRAKYHDRLPVSRPDTAPPTRGTIQTRVETAREELDHDSREVAILRDLADETSESLSYHALYAESSADDSRVRQCVGRVADLNLVAAFDGPTGRTVELLRAGREYLDALDSEIGVQQSISECVSGTGQAVPDSRDGPHAHEGRPRPAEEGAAGPERHRLPRHHSVTSLSRWHAAATAAVGREGGVALADRHWEEADDRGEAAWSFDAEAERVTVSAEYANPMQGWVCVARALASEWTFRHVLDTEAFSEGGTRLAELFGEFRHVLRESRCVGYLKTAATTEEFTDALRDAEEHLCDLTKRWEHGEFDCSPESFRGVITREAIGLASTMVHLLDLADVDVVCEWRVPNYRRWDKSDRRDLAKSIARGSAIQSRYREFAAYRQLFEDREDKRQRAIRPTVDAADPLGECITSFVVTGPGVGDPEKGADDCGDDLAELITDEIDTMERHEDAPDIQIHVPIDERAADRRNATAQALQQVCSAKKLSITREAVSWFDAFTATPYDAARAAFELGPETKAPGRRLTHHDVRYALSTLPADRIFPDAADTIGAMCKTLLSTDPDESLTNTDIESRDGPSTRSIRRHADTLAAFGVIERTDTGWRLPETLPVETDDGRFVTDVMADAIADLVPDRYADPDDPVGAALYQSPGERLPALQEAWPWLDPWVEVVRGLRDETVGPPDPPTATFGDPPIQTAVAARGVAD